ncbi:Predicted branched-chain amino acid permease (azaleucine resistance) [Agrococcus baldri]|uniref:Predicted branched-chain amino acid permease (Azaleucine resistance) n=1 Tax=Agrococcus baldri TaxID=153730 RepID=A0AA94HJJ0_9MICO|nr:AzlC family ABC transporter permease [Agrococcus baldri]SFR96755.1 Predicted branched-chain amino acid permease (azaleucine resistance) [Agrococcus baldri]
MQTDAVGRAWREGVSVVVATSAYGLSFGALSIASGLDLWQTMVLSLLMFSGGSQFAFIGVIAAGGGIAGVASAGMLGLRNALYGMSMRRVVQPRPMLMPLAAHVTIDESTAVALAQSQPKAQRIGFWVTGVGIFVGWNLATLAGALLGDLLGDPKQWGLDAAAAAAFVGLLWPRLKARQAIAVAAASAALAAALLPVAPSGTPVILAAVVGVVVGLTNWFGPKHESDLADPGGPEHREGQHA